MDKSRHAHDDKAGSHGVGVGGRLKQRLAQILRHSSCTATTSTTAFVGVATTTNAAAPPAGVTNNAASRQEPSSPRCAHEPHPKVIHGRCQHRHRPRRSSQAAVFHISIDCSARSHDAPARRDVVGAAVNKSGTRKKGYGNKLRRAPLYSWSSSSTDSDGDVAPFSSDGERGTRSSTFFSSRSFSSDSTVDFYNATGGSSTRSSSRRHHKNTPRRGAKPAAGAAFRPRAASTAGNKHGKEKKPVVESQDVAAAAGSTAVVKQSHDPYADFRSSMVEMVAGRRLRGADALAELLVWYLSLNSPRHHPAILAAFEDVWEAVLGNDP